MFDTLNLDIVRSNVLIHFLLTVISEQYISIVVFSFPVNINQYINHQLKNEIKKNRKM